MSELRQLQEEKAELALVLPQGENQFSASNKKTHSGKKKTEKKGGRVGLPFVSPRSASPTPRSPDLLSPTSASCKNYRGAIQTPKILTQGSKQGAVWTQCSCSEEPTAQST